MLFKFISKIFKISDYKTGDQYKEEKFDEYAEAIKKDWWRLYDWDWVFKYWVIKAEFISNWEGEF